uniref:Cyanobacterial aminoacyl-tRNA synthetase CAAD domain-containing protein n=1 Tax=Pyramimonas obovata TaxID=1411642 RepID=A0A7S0RBE9_9CHLO|mmetsp:Transcript_30342/g.66286  ORF Transcript_30342/g.66286 Transcript_30342/m.66286 type:complete len:458 (+) Transcript_30342:71-1444(+)
MAARALFASTSALGALKAKSTAAPVNQRATVRVSCDARESPKQVAFKTARNAALIAATSSAILAPGFAQADQLDEQLEKCTSDFCRERVLKKYGASMEQAERKARMEAFASKVEVPVIEAPAIVSGGEDAAAARAAAKEQAIKAREEKAAAASAAKAEVEAKIAAEKAAAQRAAEAAERAATAKKAAEEQAAAEEKARAAAAKEAAKGKHSLAGDTVAAVLPTAILLAATSTYLTGTTKNITDGDFEGWLEKNKDAFTAYPNKTNVGIAIALMLGSDVVFNNIPLFNLLLPNLWKLIGTSSVLYLAFRYLKEGAKPEEDIQLFVEATIPKELPTVKTVTEKTTATLTETVDYLKAVETEKLTDDVKAKVEAIDNKPVVIGYSAAFIAVLVLTGKIVNLPVLSLLLPKTTELMGVIVSIVAIDRYLVSKSATVEADLDIAKEKVSALKLPGTMKKKAE